MLARHVQAAPHADTADTRPTDATVGPTLTLTAALALARTLQVTCPNPDPNPSPLALAPSPWPWPLPLSLARARARLALALTRSLAATPCLARWGGEPILGSVGVWDLLHLLHFTIDHTDTILRSP